MLTNVSKRPRFHFESFASEFDNNNDSKERHGDNDSGIEENVQVSPTSSTSSGGTSSCSEPLSLVLPRAQRHWKKSLREKAINDVADINKRRKTNNASGQENAAPIPPPQAHLASTLSNYRLNELSPLSVNLNGNASFLPNPCSPRTSVAHALLSLGKEEHSVIRPIPLMLRNSTPLWSPAASLGSASPLKENQSNNIVAKQEASALSVQLPSEPLPKCSASRSKPYFCSTCKKSFATASGHAKHLQLHGSNQIRTNFSCKFCGKNYSSLSALKMHIRTHTLPCKCHVCGKSFSRPWLLQGHLRTHTGEKPFSCTFCPRSFADKSNLRAHLQTHLHTKKYSCQTCHKTFSRMSLLNKHVASGVCANNNNTSGIRS